MGLTVAGYEPRTQAEILQELIDDLRTVPIKPAPCFPVGEETSVILATTDQGAPSYAEVWWHEPLPTEARDWRYVCWHEGNRWD